MKEKLLHRKRAAFTVLFTLLLSVAGVTNVFAQSFTVDNLNYNINDDEASVTVTGYVGTSTTGDLVIPENVNYYGTTYSVTVIGENAFYDCGLTGTLTIGNTVHTIGNSAFSECSFTGTLTIPNSVTTIGESAFSSCTGFTGVLTIPGNVQYIGKYAFSDCVGFTSLYYNAINCYIEVEEHSEWYGEDEYYWWYEGMWLEGCFSMTVVVIGENVQTIPAFFGYSSFFAGELIIPESVTSVGYHAFDGCGFTGSLNIGNSVTSIESYAFNGCGFTGSLTIGNSVTSIGEYAFSGCGFTGSLTIGNPVTYIGDYAFGGCYGFTELNFNATNANVSSSWLEGGGEVAVSSLTTLNIGENVQRIPDGFVNGCSGIVGSLTIPNSVTYIGSNAFSGCSGFSGTLTIGNSVTQIGSYAFFGASQGFTSFVVWPETPPTLGSNVFISADYGAPVSVPCNTVEAYQNAEGWNMFTNFQNFSPCMWVITAEPNLISGGIVSGTGTYEQGSTCTLVANPNEGFSFVNWTEDGAEVSTDVEYVFTVSESRYLVANFQIDNLIGEGTATNSYLPSYSYNRYSLTQQIYTAEEIGQMGVIKNLAFFNTGTTRTRNYDIYLVYTERSAFSSSSDWASVTESDKVFSGDVTMLSNDWTIINFETPFAYNGTSNLVLVVDDNSNYYDYSSMACLVFGTSSSQALYVNSNTNYDPTNPFQYNGTLLTEKNQIALGFSSLDAVVFATVFPEEAGSVSGEGAYQLGETCSLTAIPDSEDYVFENWTENGEVVSTDAQYSFTVMGNRNLVANFLQYRFDIDASAIPEEGGMVTGAGYYLLGQTCTLIATPNENYFFINWTENGQIVSTDAAYSFMVTENRALEANFIDPIGAVHVDYFPDVLNPGSPYVGVTWNSTNTIDATIGDEISTSNEAYMPFYTLYNYSISEALYTAAELAEAGVTTGQMTSLSWDAISVTTNQVQNNISIWIANVPDIELAFTSHLAGNMTLVYTGNIGIPSLGWNEFVFNEGSFAWDGHSNVLILCQRNNGLWNGNVNWRSHNPGFIGMTYNYQDSTPYDVTTQTYAVNRSGYRPNIMFKFSYDLGNSIYYKVFRKDCDGNEYTLVADSV